MQIHTYRDWLNSKFSEVDKKIRELAFSKVVENLKKEGIDIKEIEESDLEELIADEIKKIKTFGTGFIVGVAALEILDWLF